MLERLSVTDLALVERAEITLGPGLNVVTGETGAGKTLLVDALSLLLGGKPDPDSVREGARAAVVEGEFRVDAERAAEIANLVSEWGVEFDGETLIVRREVQPNGRSRAVVNQSAVTVSALQRLGERLADFHGQHEHQSLLRPEGGLEALDRLAGLESERDAYREALAAWREASGELERLEAQLRTYAERRDYLMEAARELDGARLEDGEEEILAREAARLAHADRLRELVAGALSELIDDENAAADRLGRALHAVEQASGFDPSLEERLTALREATISANEAARALAAYASRLQADPGALEQVEERRALIARLCRKYRRSVPELLDWRDELSGELSTGEDAEATLTRAKEGERVARAACERAARALSAERRAAAAEWSSAISRELKPLGFSSARLEFVTTPREPEGATFHANGIERVEMSFTPNPGEAARPLPRIASGGELSRVMLALKCALQARDRVDLLVFDEVDSGIGGAVAQAVGERLRRLAEHRQILCVTHLALIAALGNQHVRVFKRAEKGRTVTRVDRLEGAERVEELARMLAGDRVTETTRRQARELLSPARAAAR
ncbi:MAG TPA: DNA repair protein RecN [Candidatus Sulfotelmatobacter sp.]|nr:DNA repair protein RecN [Candidatus Sulfotelmatobacter sp.]